MDELFSAPFVNIVQKFIDSIRRENLLKRERHSEDQGESEWCAEKSRRLQKKFGTQSKNQQKLKECRKCLRYFASRGEGQVCDRSMMDVSSRGGGVHSSIGRDTRDNHGESDKDAPSPLLPHNFSPIGRPTATTVSRTSRRNGSSFPRAYGADCLRNKHGWLHDQCCFWRGSLRLTRRRGCNSYSRRGFG